MSVVEGQKMSLKNNFFYLVLFAAYIPLLFLGITDLDEGAFSSTSLQMLREKQFLIPYLGDELRLEKPILTYIFQCISIFVFGISEFSLRLPSMVATFIWGFVFSKFIFSFNNDFKTTSVLNIFLLLPGIFLMSSVATADAFLNLFITLAMINIYRFCENENNEELIRCSVWIGLGFLTKGLTIIAICGAVFIIFSIITKKFNTFLGAILSIKPWLIFLTITLPWLSYVYLKIGLEPLSYMFLGQSFGRYTTAFESHDGMFYYYFIVLPFVTLTFFPDFVRSLFKLNFKDNLEKFLFTWLAFVFIFFSFSTTKLPHYLIYGLVPIVFFLQKIFLIDQERAPTILENIYQLLIWLVILGIPYALSSFLPQNNFDISLSVFEDIFNKNLYLLIVSLIILFLVLLIISRVEVNFLKKISASFFLLILSVQILPLIIDLQQKDLRELGKKYANTNEKILAYKINKPSFSFYANVNYYRGLEPNVIILTRVDKLKFLENEYEILDTQGNYLLIKITDE